MKAPSVEDIEVLDTVEDGLSVFSCGIRLLLNLYQEPVQVIYAHDIIFRVAFKPEFDILRGLNGLNFEYSFEAEAKPESMLGLGHCQRDRQETEKINDEALTCLSQLLLCVPLNTNQYFDGVNILRNGVSLNAK